MALRIVFFGTPDFAVPTLTEIVGQGHDVAAVYTQPPRPAGRGMAERARRRCTRSPTRFGLPVRTPRERCSGAEEAARLRRARSPTSPWWSPTA